MRPILALTISVFLIGGVFAYTRFADSVRAKAVAHLVNFANEEYSLVIRKTFDAAPDSIFGSESIKVMFKGETVLARSDEVLADEVIEIRPLSGVEVGENELFISVNRKSTDAALAVLLVEISRDGIPIAEQTITSEAGLPAVSGAVVFTTGKPIDEKKHEH